MAKTTRLSVRPATVRIYQQPGSDSVYYATWQWSKSDTDHYEVEWHYYVSGSSQAFPLSSDSTLKNKPAVCSGVPSNAVKISLRVRAIGPNHKEDSSKPKWDTSWTNKVYYYLKHDAPGEPGQPTLTITDSTLKVELNVDSSALNCKKIIFDIYTEDGKPVTTSPELSVVNDYVSWTTTVPRGQEYKARARAVNGDGEKSDYSGYSGNVGTIPNAVSGITSVKAQSETSVRVDWPSVSSADSYQIEYATDKTYFDSSGEVRSSTSTTNYAIITGLESGKQWFFRVRAVNSQGESEWSGISSLKIGEKPAPPTTWSSTTTVIVGETLKLFWVHNSEDGSSQETATLELTIGGNTSTIEIPNTRPEEEKDKTSIYEVNTSSYVEGTQIKWRVKTKGIMPEYSDWSVLRTVDVYARPSLALSVTDEAGIGISILTSFPMYIRGETTPSTQKPLSYHLTIIANESYETVDEVGNFKMVLKDSEVYRGFFDISTVFEYVLSANNIDLENGISYTVKCLAAMDSGLTAESTHIFTVDWGDYSGYEPELEMTFNENDCSMTILPYCARYPEHYYKLRYVRGVYILTDEEISAIEGEMVEGKLTPDGDQVYKGIDAGGEEIYFTIITDTEGILIEGVTLSVYRREFDGRFTELGKGIENNKASYIADPHPALDLARYRVIATDIATGAVVYSDVTAFDIGCPYVVIQWDEAWSDFEATEDSELGVVSPDFTGSMIKIKGNIDVSEKTQPDVSLIEYIGREQPTSYYGTQVGQSTTWNMDIPKSDKETLYGLRRLSIWMGDVYVREPSGIGYWANVTVSFNQKHRELVIPVTLDIKRVTGGV